MLTQDELREFLIYDSITGQFLRISDKRRVGVSWGTIYYTRIKVYHKVYPAHRLAWLYIYGNWPVGEIDHINGVKCDNRLINLQDVSHSQNMRNKNLITSYDLLHPLNKSALYKQLNKNMSSMG